MKIKIELDQRKMFHIEDLFHRLRRFRSRTVSSRIFVSVLHDMRIIQFLYLFEKYMILVKVFLYDYNIVPVEDAPRLVRERELTRIVIRDRSDRSLLYVRKGKSYIVLQVETEVIIYLQKYDPYMLINAIEKIGKTLGDLYYLTVRI